MVIDLDNEQGFVELSFRAIGRDKIWTEITAAFEAKTTVEAKIRDANRGGFLIRVNGIDGFLPASLLSPTHAIKANGVEDKSMTAKMKKYVGQIFNVKLVNINAETDSLIASEKAVSDEIAQFKLEKYKVGDSVEGSIIGIVDFGLFVRFDEDLEGLVHISEMSWKKVENPYKEYRVGEKSVDFDYTNENGFFDIKKNLVFDNISIRCLGYQIKEIKEYSKVSKILLIQKSLELEEVKITNNTLKINSFAKHDNGLKTLGYIIAQKGNEAGVVINNIYKEPKRIKNIILDIEKYKKIKNIVRFHIYEVNEKLNPINEIEINNNIFSIEGKHKGLIKINISNDNIVVPEGNFLLTLEMISPVIRENREYLVIRSSYYKKSHSSFEREFNKSWINLSKVFEKLYPEREKFPNLNIGLEVYE
jgi:DNA-directed RNA polymerase subunit E'/Rpb7